MNGNNIPTALQETQYGVPHKAANLPLQPNGNSANTNDPTNGSSFQDVSAVIQKNRSAKRFTGIGFIFTEADNFARINSNGCLNDGKSHPIAKRFTAYPVSPEQRLEKTVTHNGLRKYLTKPTTSKRRNNED